MLATVSADQSIKIWNVKDKEYTLKSTLDGMDPSLQYFCLTFRSYKMDLGLRFFIAFELFGFVQQRSLG
jgi:hypothetical protein